jgi:DtxR family Mn-dependent transcriptional regulator
MSGSENLEMYLVTIAMLGEDGLKGPVPLTQLAEALSVQPVSANQMVRKLDEEGLVSYLPYKGVELTDAGYQDAMHIIRRRRIWEVFFVENLGFSPTDADEIACRMEHITTPELAERLSQFLGKPHYTPGGKPIPEAEVDLPLVESQTLDTLKVGQIGEVQQINADPTTRDFLAGEGIIPGIQIKVQAISGSGNVLIQTQETQLTLTQELVRQIHVNLLEAININAH